MRIWNVTRRDLRDPWDEHPTWDTTHLRMMERRSERGSQQKCVKEKKWNEKTEKRKERRIKRLVIFSMKVWSTLSLFPNKDKIFRNLWIAFRFPISIDLRRNSKQQKRKGNKNQENYHTKGNLSNSIHCLCQCKASLSFFSFSLSFILISCFSPMNWQLM